MNDYGRMGRFGIGTPQANPTVEAECAILLPHAATLHAARLVSGSADPAQRLVDYLEGLDVTLQSYGVFRPDAFGFGCTGSSYLLGAAREAALVQGAEAAFGRPVVSATAAIRWALDGLGARRIAIVAPYPPMLLDAGVRYWEEAGFSIAQVGRVVTRSTDTSTIYELASDDARPALAALDLAGVDAVLLSGTGLATLPLLAGWSGPVPMLSSNLCLIARMLDRCGRADLLGADLGPHGWRERLAEALPA